MKRTNRRRRSGMGSRGRYYTRYIAHYTKKNWSVLLLGGLFVLGVVLGTLLVRSAGENVVELLLRMIGDFSLKRRGQAFSENLISGLTGPLQMMLVVFVCGFCAIGQPVEIGVPLFRGLGFGFSAASLYMTYGMDAVGFVAVFMLPGMILSTMALLFCCNEAVRLSGSLWRLVNGGEQELYPVRIYNARFVAAALVCGVAAVLEALVYTFLPHAFILG